MDVTQSVNCLFETCQRELVHILAMLLAGPEPLVKMIPFNELGYHSRSALFKVSIYKP